MRSPKDKANLRLALVLLTIAVVFFVGFVARTALHVG